MNAVTNFVHSGTSLVFISEHFSPPPSSKLACKIHQLRRNSLPAHPSLLPCLNVHTEKLTQGKEYQRLDFVQSDEKRN